MENKKPELRDLMFTKKQRIVAKPELDNFPADEFYYELNADAYKIFLKHIDKIHLKYLEECLQNELSHK